MYPSVMETTMIIYPVYFQGMSQSSIKTTKEQIKKSSEAKKVREYIPFFDIGLLLSCYIGHQKAGRDY